MGETVEIKAISPGTAEHLLTKVYDHQRKLNNALIERYSGEMKRVEWRDCESAIVIAVRSTGEYLLNGQHRLHAVVASGTTQKFIVRRIPYESDQTMDLAYANMDRGSNRSIAAQVHAMGLGEGHGFTDRVAKQSITALRLILDNFRPVHAKSRMYLTAPGDMQKAVLGWSNAIYAYHHSLLGAPATVQDWFWRAEVAAVALVTFRYAPEKASEFWHKVALHEDILSGSPEHLLYTLLATTKAETGAVRGSLARRVASAWNAVYLDKPINHLQSRGDSAYIQILGTPWNRRDNSVDTVQIVFGGK
jgi:hypothetical protein